MGKDLNGKDIGKGFSQRKDGRYEARAVIEGVKIDIYDFKLSSLRKRFAEEKSKVLCKVKNERPNITVEQWYNEWFERCKAPTLKSEVSKKTYYRKCNNTIIAILGDKKLKYLSQIDIQETANELCEKGYTDRSIKEAIGVFRNCLDIAVVNNIINVNPCISIVVKNANTQKERRVLTVQEQNTFLEEAKSSYYEEVYKFLLLTGLRIGEFSALRWEDIDWAGQRINISRSMQTAYINGKKIEEITTPKTNNSYRSIPFFNETESVLKSWKRKQDEYKKSLGDRWRANPEHGDLVFTSTMGSPVTRYVIVHDIKRVVDNINMKEMNNAMRENRTPVLFKHVHPHAFRHTFATRCFEKGLDPVFVQNIMGHSNYSTTLSYTHVLENIKDKEVSKINGNFL